MPPAPPSHSSDGRSEEEELCESCKWRDAQIALAANLDIDWEWYLFYRIDQHVFHLARVHPRTQWDYGEGVPLILKTNNNAQ